MTCRRRPHNRQFHRRALPEGLAGDPEHAGRKHRNGLPDHGQHLLELIGNVKLAELKVRDVQFALGKLAERLSTRSVRLARMILIQAIRNAVVNDLVVRNVAELAAVPAGEPGRPSRSLNLDQHQLRPVTRTAAIALGLLFESRGKTDGGQGGSLGYQDLD